jgi:hypothetical protein
MSSASGEVSLEVKEVSVPEQIKEFRAEIVALNAEVHVLQRNQSSRVGLQGGRGEKGDPGRDGKDGVFRLEQCGGNVLVIEQSSGKVLAELTVQVPKVDEDAIVDRVWAQFKERLRAA